MAKLPTEARKCTATVVKGKRKGQQCPAPALKDDVQCYWHADSTAQQREIARVVGGKSAARRGRNFKPANVREIDADGMLINIAALLRDVAAMPVGVNRVMAFVSLSRDAREWLIWKHAMQSRKAIDERRMIEGQAVRR